jgi:hypothetical protein
MKLFTHSYKITFFKDGKFCWDNHGWVKDDTGGLFVGLHKILFICATLLAIKAIFYM